MILDYYKILQINPDANIETIKTAYRSRALVCHPDRGGSHEQMVLVNEAFQILSNPITRARYDAARLNFENEEYVREAETNSKEAREQAEQYPRDWDEFETWMDSVINDFIRWFEKKRIEVTTKRIIQKISKQVHETFQVNPLLSFGEVLIEINNKRGIYLPDEENMVTDLYSLFSAMVYKAYRYERSHDPEALSKYNLELVRKITYDYMHIMMQNSGLPLPVSEIGEIRETGRDGRFIAYNNWTVLDTRTNLMWAAKDNRADIGWLGAKIYCEDYKGGGYKDWRMPTQDELAGLFDASQSRPAACRRSYRIHVATELIDITGFTLWASEERGSDAAEFSYAFDGGPDWEHRSNDCYSRALPVRSVK
jgi:hypothetical protein